MNILQINKFFHICDGTSRYFFNVSKLLNRNGHNVVFFSMDNPDNLSSDYSRYFVSNISYKSSSLSSTSAILNRMFYSLEAKRNISHLLDDCKVDIVHLHSIYHHISPSILPEIKKRGIPIVMTVHDYHLVAPNSLLFHNGNICEITKPDKYYQAIFHRCVKDSYLASFAEVFEKYFNSYFLNEKDLIDQFIVPSFFVKEKLESYGIKSKKITILPHFVDVKNYKPSFSQGKYIIYMGGLYPQKGVDFLIDVMERLPNIPCLIVGIGSNMEALRNKVSSRKIKNVKIMGYVKDKELIDLINNCRFTVMPSLWYEGFGFVIAEANACGKAVIASRIGAIPEIIKSNMNGILFNPNNHEDCIRAISLLWNNPSEAVKMGKRARRRIEKYYNPEGHYQKLISIYKSILP